MSVQCDMKNEVCGFKCTGYDGSEIWDKIHKAADSIECETCRDHGQKLMKFAHDTVNLGLGKHAFDKDNFNAMYKEIECVRDKCKKDGRC